MAGHRSIVEARRAAGLSQRELAELSDVAQSNIAAYESGRRRASLAMVERLTKAASPRPSVVLARHREQVLALVERRRGVAVRVFGSVARGEDRPGSDVDLLVRFGPQASLLDQAGLVLDLEELLGVTVDVVSEAGLGVKHDRILTEARPL